MVIVTAATSVRCRYYARFASHLAHEGFDVLTYDYRGIGESRPKRLRGFPAGWTDWGEKDFEGALQFAATQRPGQPLYAIGHSIGGFAIGAAPSSPRLSRILTVGAQFAYWRDYARDSRLKMYWKWHVVMPLVARLLGYVPAKRLGWMEDTPRGVALDWSSMGSRFEDTLQSDESIGGTQGSGNLADRFGRIGAPILAVSLSDDPYGTPSAIERLLGYFTASHRLHLHLRPADLALTQIGHFAFFHERFHDSLWPIAVSWLRDGTLPPPLDQWLLPARRP